MSERADKLLRLMTRADRLESLPRTGWLVGGVVQPESIAAHLYGVAVGALWIADTIEEQVDVERLLRIALLHDLGEALTSDLPRPVKRLIGKASVDAAEEAAFATIADDAGVPWLGAWDDYQAADSLEARIVKAADRIQMLVKAAIYEKQGRGDVARFFEGRDPSFGIPVVDEVFERLRERRNNGEWFDADFD
jgi:putative hydrolase of HD superfamily